MEDYHQRDRYSPKGRCQKLWSFPSLLGLLVSVMALQRSRVCCSAWAGYYRLLAVEECHGELGRCLTLSLLVMFISSYSPINKAFYLLLSPLYQKDDIFAHCLAVANNGLYNFDPDYPSTNFLGRLLRVSLIYKLYCGCQDRCSTCDHTYQPGQSSMGHRRKVSLAIFRKDPIREWEFY